MTDPITHRASHHPVSHSDHPPTPRPASTPLRTVSSSRPTQDDFGSSRPATRSVPGAPTEAQRRATQLATVRAQVFAIPVPPDPIGLAARVSHPSLTATIEAHHEHALHDGPIETAMAVLGVGSGEVLEGTPLERLGVPVLGQLPSMIRDTATVVHELRRGDRAAASRDAFQAAGEQVVHAGLHAIGGHVLGGIVQAASFAIRMPLRALADHDDEVRVAGLESGYDRHVDEATTSEHANKYHAQAAIDLIREGHDPASVIDIERLHTSPAYALVLRAGLTDLAHGH